MQHGQDESQSEAEQIGKRAANLEIEQSSFAIDAAENDAALVSLENDSEEDVSAPTRDQVAIPADVPVVMAVDSPSMQPDTEQEATFQDAGAYVRRAESSRTIRYEYRPPVQPSPESAGAGAATAAAAAAAGKTHSDEARIQAAACALLGGVPSSPSPTSLDDASIAAPPAPPASATLVSAPTRDDASTPVSPDAPAPNHGQDEIKLLPGDCVLGEAGETSTLLKSGAEQVRSVANVILCRKSAMLLGNVEPYKGVILPRDAQEKAKKMYFEAWANDQGAEYLDRVTQITDAVGTASRSKSIQSSFKTHCRKAFGSDLAYKALIALGDVDELFVMLLNEEKERRIRRKHGRDIDPDRVNRDGPPRRYPASASTRGEVRGVQKSSRQILKQEKWRLEQDLQKHQSRWSLSKGEWYRINEELKDELKEIVFKFEVETSMTKPPEDPPLFSIVLENYLQRKGFGMAEIQKVTTATSKPQEMKRHRRA